MNLISSDNQQPSDARLAAAWLAAAAVPDPEIPVVTVADLGILRSVDVDADGVIVAKVSPTYSGCPATSLIQQMVLEALVQAGFDNARVDTVLSPAWTTDWITADGRRKLHEFGIAPPVVSSNSKRVLFGETLVNCPHCGAGETDRISEFGSTPCKALYRCTVCKEPFDYFKCL